MQRDKKMKLTQFVLNMELESLDQIEVKKHEEELLLKLNRKYKESKLRVYNLPIWLAGIVTKITPKKFKLRTHVYYPKDINIVLFGTGNRLPDEIKEVLKQWSMSKLTEGLSITKVWKLGGLHSLSSIEGPVSVSLISSNIKFTFWKSDKLDGFELGPV